MNNLVLQKLLHSPMLYKTNLSKFSRTFIPSGHIGNENTEKEIHPNILSGFLDFHSKRIQQSMKFHIPLAEGDNKLTEEEVVKLQNDITYFLPYKSTFIQSEASVDLSEEEKQQIISLYPDSDIHKSKLDAKNVTATYNVYLEDTESVDDTGSLIYRGCVFIYFSDSNEFYYDPNDYFYSFREDGSYTFWLPEEGSFYPYTDTTAPYDNGPYSNPSLNSMVALIISAHTKLCLMLTYPQITNTSSVKGIKIENANRVPLSYKFSTSEFIRKPKYEHKILKLDLFGSNGTSNTTNSNETGGRAFHAVRKHIRQYQDGKITFVKAHFRGSKDIGIVTKDYEFKTNTDRS